MKELPTEGPVFVMANPKLLKTFKAEHLGGSQDGREYFAVSYRAQRDGELIELAVTAEVADKLVKKIKRWKKNRT